MKKKFVFILSYSLFKFRDDDNNIILSWKDIVILRIMKKEKIVNFNFLFYFVLSYFNKYYF